MNYLLSKEQLEIYKKAENHLYTTLNLSYKLPTSKALNDELADIYEEVTFQKIKRNWSCNRCCYNAYLKFAKLYYESLEYYENEEVEPIKEETPVVKKRGRTRKSSK